MPRFSLERDLSFFEGISRELVEAVVETAVILYKLIIDDSSVNLYGESTSKTYYQGIGCNAMIEREETTTQYEGFGSDTVQNVEFRFNRFILQEKGFYPEIGDIVFHNDAYFEVDNVKEDQLIGGQVGNKWSIICSTFMTRRTTIQTDEHIL